MQQQTLIGEVRQIEEFVEDRKLRLCLPYPPSVNSANQMRTQLPSIADMKAKIDELRGTKDQIREFRKWLQGKVFTQTYKSQHAKDFRVEVWAIVSQRQARKHWDTPMSITMHVYPPDRRKRDTSNLWKITEDALQAAGVVTDDELFKEHHSFMNEPRPGGMVVVEIALL